MDNPTVARFERAIMQLRIIAILTTLAAIGAGIAAVIALREPTAIRIGDMRLDGKSLIFEGGDQYTRIDRAGLWSASNGDVAFVRPQTIQLHSDSDHAGGYASSAQLLAGSKDASLTLTAPRSTARLGVQSGPIFEVPPIK